MTVGGNGGFYHTTHAWFLREPGGGDRIHFVLQDEVSTTACICNLALSLIYSDLTQLSELTQHPEENLL